LFDNVREDLRRALSGNQHATGLGPLLLEMLNPGTQAVLVFRLGKWIDGIRVPGVRQVLKVGFMLLQYVVSWRVGIFIPVKAEIGPGLLIHTWGGGIFLPATRIGRNLTIIGGGVQMDYETREIGDDVNIAPGTKMIGKIRIGHRARTGPNSVVQTDVPDDCVVVGNPGRVIGPVPKLTYEQGAKRIVPKSKTGPSPAPESQKMTMTLTDKNPDAGASSV
jgi:serine O-acetyltransferase